MKRTAKVERFKSEFGDGWKVICKEGNEIQHELYIYRIEIFGEDMSLRVALSRAEMWLACGVALAFPVVGADAASAGAIQ